MAASIILIVILILVYFSFENFIVRYFNEKKYKYMIYASNDRVYFTNDYELTGDFIQFIDGPDNQLIKIEISNIVIVDNTKYNDKVNK
jgi:hypothetical protein